MKSSPSKFEHVVLEAALNSTCTNLNNKIQSVSPNVTATLAALRNDSKGLDILQQTQVDELLPLKNKLDDLRKRLQELKRAIHDVLEDDEALQLMYLDSHHDDSKPNADFRDKDKTRVQTEDPNREGGDVLGNIRPHELGHTEEQHLNPRRQSLTHMSLSTSTPATARYTHVTALEPSPSEAQGGSVLSPASALPGTSASPQMRRCTS